LDTYLYNYIVGALFFCFGLFIAFKQGDIGFKPGQQRNNLFILIAGLLFFMLLQGYFQFFS